MLTGETYRCAQVMPLGSIGKQMLGVLEPSATAERGKYLPSLDSKKKHALFFLVYESLIELQSLRGNLLGGLATFFRLLQPYRPGVSAWRYKHSAEEILTPYVCGHTKTLSRQSISLCPLDVARVSLLFRLNIRPTAKSGERAPNLTAPPSLSYPK